MREAYVWSQLKNDHIIEFLGFYFSSSEGKTEALLVCPWMENGESVRYVKQQRLTPGERLQLVRETYRTGFGNLQPWLLTAFRRRERASVLAFPRSTHLPRRHQRSKYRSARAHIHMPTKILAYFRLVQCTGQRRRSGCHL